MFNSILSDVGLFLLLQSLGNVQKASLLARMAVVLPADGNVMETTTVLMALMR